MSKIIYPITLRSGKNIIYYNGALTEWYVNGQLHRDHDLPACVHEYGPSKWFQQGKLHRVGKPAIIFYDQEEWYINGKRHRINGPAVVHDYNPNHSSKFVYPAIYNEWWIHGVQITEEQFNDKKFLIYLGLVS